MDGSLKWTLRRDGAPDLGREHGHCQHRGTLGPQLPSVFTGTNCAATRLGCTVVSKSRPTASRTPVCFPVSATPCPSRVAKVSVEIDHFDGHRAANGPGPQQHPCPMLNGKKKR